MSTINLWTAKEAAELLRISDARVRQICIEHNIGVLKGTTRILTDSDMKKLKTIRSRLREYGKSEDSK